MGPVSLFLVEGCFDERVKEGVRREGAGFHLGMELRAEHKWVFFL